MDSVETRYAPTDLIRALDAIQRTQARWLEDVARTCSNKEPCFREACRRWAESLSLIQLHLVRAEQRLLHFLLVPEDRRPWRDLPGNPRKHDRRERFAHWNSLILPYVQSLRISTSYRRIANILDLEQEAVTADVITDLVALAEMCENTGEALDRFKNLSDKSCLEDLAFYHVLSPWKQQGMQALLDTQRWLHAYLRQHDEI